MVAILMSVSQIIISFTALKYDDDFRANPNFRLKYQERLNSNFLNKKIIMIIDHKPTIEYHQLHFKSMSPFFTIKSLPA